MTRLTDKVRGLGWAERAATVHSSTYGVDSSPCSDIGFRLVFDGTSRVRQGGSWRRNSDDAADSDDFWNDPGYRFTLLGFRLAREDK